MYRLLLSWRYLRTRWIAMASIISVMLGVATLIVVNSVMAGFSEEMYKRLHGILSDLVCESGSIDGTPDAEGQMRGIQRVLGDQVQGMTPIVHVPALLRMRVRGEYHTRQINLIGIDEATYGKVSDFSQYLLHPLNQRQLSFQLREDGYAPDRDQFPPSGWQHRRLCAENETRRGEADDGRHHEARTWRPGTHAVMVVHRRRRPARSAIGRDCVARFS